MFIKNKEDCDIAARFIKVLDLLKLEYANDSYLCVVDNHPCIGHTKYGHFVTEQYLRGDTRGINYETR